MTSDVIGASVVRLEGRDKVSGRAGYVDDLSRPRMLHAALVLAPHAHARIRAIDLDAARALPGVRAIVTGRDFPRRYGAFVKDEEALAHEVVRYFGEPVVAIAADDLATARHAATLVHIDYDELPVLATPEAARAPDAPRIHADFEAYERRYAGPLPPNVCAHTTMREGDVDAAFARCDVIVEGEFSTPPQVHCYLEPCGALAELDDAGRLVIWSPCQAVSRVQATVAEALGLPMARVRVIATRVGGAFGGKADVTVQPIAALLALRTRRPVKLVLARNDDFLMMRTRHPARVWMRTGALADGTLVAREARVVMDGGAYAEDSAAVLGFALLMARGPYRIANVRVEGEVVYTNRLRAAGFRGYGNPQVSFPGESQIDQIAERLGRDPLELRLQNAMVAGDAWMGGERARACGLVECLERVRDAAGWSAAARSQVAGPGKRRGLGVACLAHICGILSTSAIVRVVEDGTVNVNTGAVDLGEGADTVLAQICAQALRIPLDQVSFAPADTDASPYNWSTGGSRVTYMVGRAIGEAAADVRGKLFAHAASILECAPDDLELRDGGRVGIVGVPGREVTFRAISQRAHWVAGGPVIGNASLMYDGDGVDPKRTVVTGNGLGRLGVFTFGAQLAEVEVDEATGEVRVLRLWAAHDVGRAINPAGVRGQIAGGVAQGIGYALVEDLVYDGGRPANPSLMDYKTPGVCDLPEIVPIIVEHPEPTHPFGAKGVGEPPIIGVAPAVANAIAAACGVRLTALPMTPERVLHALDARASPPLDARASAAPDAPLSSASDARTSAASEFQVSAARDRR